jgi:hypothetical protein
MDTGILAPTTLSLIAIVIAVTIAYVAVQSYKAGRSISSASLNSGRSVVKYGDAPKAFAIVLGTLVPASVLLLGMSGRMDFNVALWILLADFFIVGYCAPEFFRTRIEFDSKEVYAYSPWRKARVIPWTVIMSRKYSSLKRWNVFDTFGYGSLRVSDFMEGRGKFIERFNAFGEESVHFQRHQAQTAS